MSRLLLGAVFVTLSAGTAFAQAPGQIEPSTAPVDPYASPPLVVPDSVMAHRWALGLSFGAFGIAPEENPDAETDFQIASIALRFRATPSIEFALELAGGRQVLDDGTAGDLATDSAMIVGRYRFMAEQPWNIFLTGGFGAVVIAPHDSTKAERDAERRPFGMIGVGIERRFERFALQAELRAVGVGPREMSSTVTDTKPPTGTGPATGGTGMTPPPIDPTPPPLSSASDKFSGGTFTLGASYYW
jgi:hypothetical protein